MVHKHVIYYFLFRKRGGGGGCLGGLNQIKQPRVADFFFAYPLLHNISLLSHGLRQLCMVDGDLFYLAWIKHNCAQLCISHLITIHVNCAKFSNSDFPDVVKLGVIASSTV